MSRVIGVTGAHGFIGSALVEAGERRGLDMQKIILPRDLTQLSAEMLARHFPSERIDAVINAAAVRHPKSMAEKFLNARGPAMLREALDQRIRLLHVSSLNVLLPYAADSYAQTKIEGELGLAGQPGVVILRPSLVWDVTGKRGDARQIHRAVKSIPLVVPIPRPGPTFRPVGVSDLANTIIEIAIEQDPPAVVNFSGASVVTLCDLFKAIARRYKKRTLSLPIEAAIPRKLRRFLPRMVRACDPDALSAPQGLQRGLDCHLPRPKLVL